ncbi:MAG: MGMT family protein [Candidatus Pacebacteria bacterium]|nr:MGMT family protein [Candidatus Paceibacterota bacterium]
MSFKEKVLMMVSETPKGETLTYKQVAQMAGSPKAYRAVGNILAKNFNPKIPCHRVIKSNGQPGNYNRGQENKIKILKYERANLLPKSGPLKS